MELKRSVFCKRFRSTFNFFLSCSLSLMKLLIFWSAFCATKLFPAKKEVLYNIVKADDKYVKSVRTRVCCFTDKELLYKSERKAKRLRLFNPSRSTVVKRRLQTFFQSLPQRLSSTLRCFFFTSMAISILRHALDIAAGKILRGQCANLNSITD